MESSTSSLMYKGSISDAIVEAQKQKKLIMVYISGDDENSNSLERSTWVDPIVVEAISKYCIFLHLVQGSVGASQFSDIYPQKSVPTITAVGYNGVPLLQHEGYITEENLVRSIEKAWASLQLQETAATLLSAAIVSKKPELTSSGSCNVVPVAEGDSSSSDVPSTSAEIPPESPERELLADPKLIEAQNVCESNADPKDIKPSEDSETHPQTASDADMIICEVEQLNSGTNSIKEGTDLVSGTTDQSGTANDGYAPTRPQENTAMVESYMMTSESTKRTTSTPEPSQITGKEVEESSQIKVSNSIKTNDVYLNIRLPNGASLQAKFTIIDTLRTVKKYIDENQIGSIGSYDLAIPYPRKVFSDQDMNNPLSELGFSNRQALLVILRHQATGHPRSQIPPNNGILAVNEDDSSGRSSGGGYFDYLRRVISYMNPFSYIGGNGSSSSSETTSSDSSWQYRPNPALQNQLSEAEAYRRSHNLDNRNPSSRDSSSGTRTTSRPFGSNIHTLRRDEDEGQSRDKNTFWNGNSTEYGGDDK